MIFGALIAGNCVLIGAETEMRATDTVPEGAFNGVWLANSFFLFFFAIEIMLRVRAEGCRHYFTSAWGIFDSFVTFTGIVDTWVMLGFVVKVSSPVYSCILSYHISCLGVGFVWAVVVQYMNSHVNLRSFVWEVVAQYKGRPQIELVFQI